MLHACDQRFDVTKNLENCCELNCAASRSRVTAQPPPHLAVKALASPSMPPSFAPFKRERERFPRRRRGRKGRHVVSKKNHGMRGNGRLYYGLTPKSKKFSKFPVTSNLAAHA